MADPTLPTTTDAPLAPSPVADDAPAIRDAWPWTDRMPLTGWLERNAFHPLWTALLVFVLAFVLFQVVIAPIVIGVGVALDLMQSGGGEAPDAGELLASVMENSRLLMTANTIGQIVGFALFAVFAARRHTPNASDYLRFRRPDGLALGLAALGWAVLYPAVLWVGQLNELIPLPEWLQVMEQSQVELIEGLLLGGNLGTGFLFVALALTPAVCEELLFRGYLQRQVERGWGTATSILLVGVLFGLYHLRLSQAIPLSLLGVYLGYVVWATGSLWSGMLVHLLNNGLAVVMAGYARQNPDLDLEALEAASMPWYFGLAGLVLAAGMAYALYQRRQSVVGDRPDSAPAPLPLSPDSPSPVL